LTGEKVCRFYRLKPPELKVLRVSLAATKVTPNPMQAAYPFLLGENELKKMQLGQPTLIAVEAVNGGLAAVYGSVRAPRVREEVDPTKLPDGAAKMLSGYDEVIGLKLIRHQAIDVVGCPTMAMSSIFASITRRGLMQTWDVLPRTLITSFTKLVKTDSFRTPVNLFPLLSKMYDSAGEGRVVEIAFGTTTRSVMHERARAHAGLGGSPSHRAVSNGR
jgi:hypothetical protein